MKPDGLTYLVRWLLIVAVCVVGIELHQQANKVSTEAAVQKCQNLWYDGFKIADGLFYSREQAEKAHRLVLVDDLQHGHPENLMKPLGGWTLFDQTTGSDWQVESLFEAAGATNLNGASDIADIKSRFIREADGRIKSLEVTCRNKKWSISKYDPAYYGKTLSILAEIEQIHAKEALEELDRKTGTASAPK